MHSQQPDPATNKSSDIIPFPFNARTKQVRQCADALMTKSEQAAMAHWRRTLSRMGDKLLKLGFSQDAVQEQYQAFKCEVENEMNRRMRHMPPPPTGGRS